MLKKLTEKIKNRKIEKERNKPQFLLSDLYAGEIVLFKKSIPVKNGINNNYYKPVKKIAIFTKEGLKAYKHVKSQQVLCEMGKHDSIVGDFAIVGIQTFHNRFPIYMRKNDLSETSLVSLAFIEDFEEDMNTKLDPKQEIDELFL